MRIRTVIVLPLLAIGFSFSRRLEAQVSLPAQLLPVYGYARSDGVSSVVYRGPNSHVYELYLPPGGHWALGNLTNLFGAPLAATNPTAWVRYDYQCGPPPNGVDYVSSNGDIHEMVYAPCLGGWHHENLTASSGAPPAITSAQPSPRRWDSFGGIPSWSVAYKSATDGHLWQITQWPQTNAGIWMATDVTLQSGAPTCGPPTTVSVWSGYQDLFCIDPSGHVIHLSQYWKYPWVVEDLMQATNAAPTATTQMAAWARPDDYTSLAYRTIDGGINELYQHGPATPWSVGSPSGLAGAPKADSGPVSYTRQDNTFSIVYNAQGHIIELHLTNNWHFHDLTALTNAPLAQTGRPSAYRRADGVNSVVYRGTNSRIYELYSYSGDTWQVGDLLSLVP